MKRTWVVYVGLSVGHEMHDLITEAEWYGPLTKKEASNLEVVLNRILDDGEKEHREAVALPLQNIPCRKIVKYHKESMKV